MKDLTELLEILNDPESPLPAALVYRLSDITLEDLAVLTAAWPQIDVEQRRKLAAAMVTTSEAAFDVDFSTAARLALDDPDGQVRKSAIKALWTDHSVQAMRLFTRHLANDPDEDVQAAAATALGIFVFQGALEEIPQKVAKEAERALFEAHGSTTSREVKRRALESLAYSEEERVVTLISEAWGDPHLKMKVSALFAMGRNADKRWRETVLITLDADEPELRFEAARAAGELGIEAAVEKLIRLTREADYEIKMEAVWALGEIGGTEAQNRLFEMSDEETDPELLLAIDDALSMAMLTTGDFGDMLFGQIGLDDDLFDMDDDDV